MKVFGARIAAGFQSERKQFAAIDDHLRIPSLFAASKRSVFTPGLSQHHSARTTGTRHHRGQRAAQPERRHALGHLEQRSSNIMNTYPHRESFTDTSIRTAIGLGALAPLLLLAAGTASADPPNGTYDVETPQGQIGVWTITSCGPGCAHIHGGGGSKKQDPGMAGDIVDTQVYNGQGSFTANPSSLCPDGTSLTQAQSYTVNLATMTGTVAVIPLRCAAHRGSDGPPFTRTFTLTKI
jgi:hypothetical protein